MRPAYASKPDASRAAIVAAIRKLGASWEDVQGRKGIADGVWGFKGRMGWAEIKRPGKENGVCGCTAKHAQICVHAIGTIWCQCSGHDENDKEPNAERKTWHAQLAFREAWKGPAVVVWTTPQEAIDTITKET